MPQNNTVPVPAKTWTEITDANIASITFQAGGTIHVKGTVGTGSPPTDLTGALQYREGSGELNTELSAMFPGDASVNRVWAYSFSGTSVVVSHA